MVETFGWRSIFWFNLPTGIVVLALSRFLLKAGAKRSTGTGIDLLGAGFLFGIVFTFMFGLSELGNNETGAAAALPIWMSYMGKALKGVDAMFQQVPEGVVSASVNPDTGLAATDGRISEYFYRENIPAAQNRDASGDGSRSPEEVKNQLF